MGGMWLWWLVGLALLAVVVWAVARAAGSGGGRSAESPEQILKRRYAAGDIDRDEFERRLNDLRT